MALAVSDEVSGLQLVSHVGSKGRKRGVPRWTKLPGGQEHVGQKLGTWRSLHLGVTGRVARRRATIWGARLE